MISKKVTTADGITQRFLSDFIIRSEQYVRVYCYVYDASIIDINGELQNPGSPWEYPSNLYKRNTDAPTSDDLVGLSLWDLVDNSILFYDTPLSTTRVWMEVATTSDEFGDTLVQPASERAEAAAEASATSASESAISASESAISASNAADSATEVSDKVHTVDTVADMLLVDTLLHTNINVLGHTIVNDEGGGLFKYDPTQSAINNGGTIIDGWIRQSYSIFVTTAQFGITDGGSDSAKITSMLEYCKTNNKTALIPFDIDIEVPTNIATLQDAIALTRPYKKGFELTINIATGHSPSSGINLSNGDYSQHKITSTDATVTLDITFPQTDDFIYCKEGQAPKLSCLINANGRALNGYRIERNSSGYIDENCGVINTKGDANTGGLCIFYSSNCYAKNSVFTGSYRNLWVSHESQCYADFSNLSSGTGDTNVYIGRSSIGGVSYSDMTNGVGAGLRVRRSLVTALAADVSNSGADGILAQENSTIVCNDQLVDSFLANNCGQNAVNCDKSVVDFDGGTATGTVNKSIQCTNGGKVTANRAILSTLANPSKTALSATNGEIVANNCSIDSCTSTSVEAFSDSSIDITDSTIGNSTGRSIDLNTGACLIGGSLNISNSGADAFRIQGGARVIAPGLIINTVTGRGMDVYDNSKISARGINLTGASSDGIRLSNISNCSIDTGTVSGTGGLDLVVQSGSSISATGTTTTNGVGTPSLTDVNITTFNTLDANGVIFT